MKPRTRSPLLVAAALAVTVSGSAGLSAITEAGASPVGHPVLLAGTPPSTATVSPSASLSATGTPGPGRGRPDADQPRKDERKKLFIGEVTAVGSNQLTVKDRNGRTATVLVDSATRYRQPGKKDASFADIKAGMRLAIYGPVASTDRTAAAPTLTALMVQLPKVEARFAHRIGEITSISATTVSLKDREGKTHTGMLNDKTRKLPVGATFAVGDRVLALARFDESQGTSGGWVVTQLVKAGLPEPRASAAPSAAPAASPSASPTPSATSTATASATATRTAGY